MITRGLLDIAWPSLPRNATGIGKGDYGNLRDLAGQDGRNLASGGRGEAASPGRATPHPSSDPVPREGDRAAAVRAGEFPFPVT